MTCALLPGQCLLRVFGTLNNVSLTGEGRELALRQVSLEALQNTVTMDTNLTGRGVCLCVHTVRGKTRRTRGKDRTLCVRARTCKGRECAGAVCMRVTLKA